MLEQICTILMNRSKQQLNMIQNGRIIVLCNGDTPIFTTDSVDSLYLFLRGFVTALDINQ